MAQTKLSPSVMCADLVDLKRSIEKIEAVGVDALHIDLIDGEFSPSMPLGIDTVAKMRELTNMPFDAHIMALNNEFFIQEVIKIGMESITFHYESSLHIDRYIKIIKQSGAKVGIALNPATPLSALEFILPEVDMIVLMLINPGFATDKNEEQVSYALKKVSNLKEMITNKGLTTSIQVDGRVSLETIPGLIRAGADNLVLGSTSLFIKENTLEENKKLVEKAVKLGNIEGGN